MSESIEDRLEQLEEKVNALEARTVATKGVSESFLLRITEQLRKLEARVTALEKKPPKKQQRKLLINLEVLNQDGRTADGETNESRIERAIEENLK
jgi:hypothetical protein